MTPKLKFLLLAPLFVLPFLCVVFRTLGGGQGSRADSTARAMGLNTRLPAPAVNRLQMIENKVSAYKAADQDSMRKREEIAQDRYSIIARKDSVQAAGLRMAPVVKRDPRADQLLVQLRQLQQSMRGPTGMPDRGEMPGTPVTPVTPVMPVTPLPRAVRRLADTGAADPQLEKLNSMLDKVIRIQHPGESNPAPGSTARGASATEDGDLVLAADSGSNVIKAIIPTDQVLVTGGTLSLRLMQDVVIHGVVVPRGQLIYGVVSISNDRMLVHVRSFWDGRNLYSTELQVYDLDGLPGIHIPGMLSQDVAKQSADESVNGLNLSTYDPSIGAQAANAGIQAAKTFLGRKVRLVRVSVRAGYAVLLLNAKMSVLRAGKTAAATTHPFSPPHFVPGGAFIHRCRTEGVEVALQGIYLKDSLLWLALQWSNHSPIAYHSDFCRWFIRDKKAFKRTAQQELVVEPLCTEDSAGHQWVGFRPFALAKDKELVLEAGERNGGRTLTLVIHHQELLKAKPDETQIRSRQE